MAKQKVALECLSYHATASQDQTVKLAHAPIKSAEDYKLYSFKFIGEDDDVKYVIWFLIKRDLRRENWDWKMDGLKIELISRNLKKKLKIIDPKAIDE